MGGYLSILTIYDWYDWINVLNPMYLRRRLQMLKYRIYLTADLYVFLPILKLKNSLFGTDTPTLPRHWDYDTTNETDDSIVEPQISDLSKRLKSDFLSNKHGPYVHRALALMNNVMPRYIRGQVAKPLNETSLYNFITSTTLSFSCAPDGNSLDLSLFNRVPRDLSRKHDILPAYTFKLDHDNRKAYVFDVKDKPVPPNEPNVAVVLSSALLAFTHSFVHFHLPTSMALFADKLMGDPGKKKSRLATLLDRHSRFTLVFNYAGHNMFFPVQNQNWSFPYCFRITQKDFAFLNIARTQHYYKLTAENQTGHFISNMSQYKDKIEFDDRFVFHRMVKTYYDYIDSYVRDFGIEANLLEEFMDYVKKLVPTIKVEDPMTMLVTLIWQVSILHSMDHYMIYQQREYMAFGDPTDPWNVAVSNFVLDTYVKPFLIPGQKEELANHVDITGLPNWDWMCNSISF